MAKFLIESPHDPDRIACARIVESFLRSGSHFLTHADWGFLDGDHKAWIMGEFNSKDEARSILPPAMRAQAKVVRLNTFTLEKIEAILCEHQATGQRG